MAHDSQRSLSILIATFNFPPEVNGVAKASSTCARVLLGAGWRVDIATSPTIPPRKELTWEGANIYEFDLGHEPVGIDRHSSAASAYREFLEQGSWDVIIFQGYLWPLQLAIPLLATIKSKKVLVSHGYAALRWFPVKRFPFGLGQWARSLCKSVLMLWWTRYIDRWVFLSDRCDLDAYFDQTLARVSGHRGIRIIPNAAETPKIEADAVKFRSAHGISKDAFVLLFVAYYSRGKDQGFAVRAFRRANIPGSVLVFIATEFNEWSQKFQTYDDAIPASQKNGRVIWLEKQTRNATLAAFRESDAFVLSSRLETQPIVLLEAMSYAKPWIARAAGCIDRMEGGICVKSVRGMATAMRRLANDDNLRSRIGAAGRLAIEQTYNSARYSSSYCRLLKELEQPTQTQ